MKKVASILCIALMLITCSFAKAQEKERLSPPAKATGENISISYGQPSKRGRVIFGVLVPYNMVWRTGANEATEITITKDCMFGDKKLHAGTYTLFTIPGKEEWTVILNSTLGQWGAFGYDKIKDKDVLKVTVKAKHLETVVEKMTFAVEKDAIKLDWDQTGISIPVKFP